MKKEIPDAGKRINPLDFDTHLTKLDHIKCVKD
jgi:hypothetical protein